MSELAPVLECVAFNASGPDIAVWGYRNRSGDPAVVTIGRPRTTSRRGTQIGKPERFEPGRYVGVFQTEFEATSTTLTWTLTGQKAEASADSQPCTATVELRKVVIPADDPGVFRLRLNNTVVATGGNGTTTGPITVGVGEATVSETAGSNTSLADYVSSVECARNGDVAVSVPGTKVDAEVANGDVVVCTFTNRRNGTTRAARAAEPSGTAESPGTAQATCPAHRPGRCSTWSSRSPRSRPSYVSVVASRGR